MSFLKHLNSILILDDTTEAGQGVLDVVPEDEFVLIGVQHILVPISMPMRDVVITDRLKVHHTFLHFCVLDALDESPRTSARIQISRNSGCPCLTCTFWRLEAGSWGLEHIVSTIQECRRTIILHSFLEWIGMDWIKVGFYHLRF